MRFTILCQSINFFVSLSTYVDKRHRITTPLYHGHLRRQNATSRVLAGYFENQFLTFLLLEPHRVRVIEIHDFLERTVSNLPRGCAHFEVFDVSSLKGRTLSLMLFQGSRPGLTLLRRGHVLVGASDNLEHLLDRASQECHDTYWKPSAVVFLHNSAKFQRSFLMSLLRHLESLPWDDMRKNKSQSHPVFLGGYRAPHAGWARAGVQRSAFSLAWIDFGSHINRVIVVTDVFRIRRNSIPLQATGRISVISTSRLHSLPSETIKSSWFILCPLEFGALAEAARVLAARQGTFDAVLMRSNLKRPRPMRAPSKPQPGKPTRISWMLWLHVPKTGTSFARTVYQHACKQWSTSKFLKLPNASKPEHFDNELSWSADLNCIPGLREASTHVPKRRTVPGLAPGQHMHRGQVVHRLREFPGRAVTMLRKPSSRIRSAFRSLLGHREAAELYLCGSCGDNFDGHVPLQMAVARSIISGQLGFAEFAKLEHTRGCYAKLLLGNTCLPTNAVQLATKRLRDDFIFVGLSEHWVLSVCLFHAMFDGHQPQANEFQNSRPTPVSKDFVMEDHTVVVDDQVDEAIYAEAVAIFEQNVADFHVEIQNLGPFCVEGMKRIR